ncbi:MAG TPA: hypothetical protein VGD46_10575 [Rhizobacter sp.]
MSVVNKHDANDKRQGRTKPQQGDTQAASSIDVPRLPHERDESSDSHAEAAPRPLIRQAHDDIEKGRVDTDRGTPMNETYQRQKEAPQKKK